MADLDVVNERGLFERFDFSARILSVSVSDQTLIATIWTNSLNLSVSQSVAKTRDIAPKRFASRMFSAGWELIAETLSLNTGPVSFKKSLISTQNGRKWEKRFQVQKYPQKLSSDALFLYQLTTVRPPVRADGDKVSAQSQRVVIAASVRPQRCHRLRTTISDHRS